MENPNDTKTRLMTLLNVSHLNRTSKRKIARGKPIEEGRIFSEPPEKRVKLNKKRVVVEPDPEKPTTAPTSTNEAEAEIAMVDMTVIEEEEEVVQEDDIEPEAGDSDPFVMHFGPLSSHISDESKKAVDGMRWRKASKTLRSPSGSGPTTISYTVDLKNPATGTSLDVKQVLVPRLATLLDKCQAALARDLRDLQYSVLDALITSSDLNISNVRLHEHRAIREACSLYLLNHILKIRRTVLKNNDRVTVATSKSAAPPEDVQDQGFTRPSTLILVPFRNSALAFLQSFLDHYTSSSSGSNKKTQEAQIHHYSRFVSQYSLPPGSIDKLATADPGTYPEDHVQTFSGNIDDNFRMGVKVTKRSVRLFEGFFGADLIVASPLGLRLACEKEGNADFLSSIEVIVVDQMDAMTMQNWDHVQFVFSHLNQIPKGSHDADFSRIKPWYLDGLAGYLRQTILLTQYETPETRALFNSLKNVAGKSRTVTVAEGVKVPEGIEQSFMKFECLNPRDEADKRFEYFTKKIFPATLKSAVQSANSLIFVPSYFDFVRIQNWLLQNGVSCAFISEYSSNPDISRARQAFFGGDKSLLVITERFHFFRRYRLRGLRNVLFYAPPDHPQFYTELLSFPFLDDGVQASDITVKVLYSKYDLMRLERIVGGKAVGPLIRD